jgi:hypothetical protein
VQPAIHPAPLCCAEGEFAVDVAHGQGTILSASGASYSGEWRDGKPCGRGVESNARGDAILMGDWVQASM